MRHLSSSRSMQSGTAEVNAKSHKKTASIPYVVAFGEHAWQSDSQQQPSSVTFAGHVGRTGMIVSNSKELCGTQQCGEQFLSPWMV